MITNQLRLMSEVITFSIAITFLASTHHINVYFSYFQYVLYIKIYFSFF